MNAGGLRHPSYPFHSLPFNHNSLHFCVQLKLIYFIHKMFDNERSICSSGNSFAILHELLVDVWNVCVCA